MASYTCDRDLFLVEPPFSKCFTNNEIYDAVIDDYPNFIEVVDDLGAEHAVHTQGRNWIQYFHPVASDEDIAELMEEANDIIIKPELRPEETLV